MVCITRTSNTVDWLYELCGLADHNVVENVNKVQICLFFSLLSQVINALGLPLLASYRLYIHDYNELEKNVQSIAH